MSNVSNSPNATSQSNITGLNILPITLNDKEKVNSQPNLLSIVVHHEDENERSTVVIKDSKKILKKSVKSKKSRRKKSSSKNLETEPKQKKYYWTKEEDIQLLNLITKYGKKWTMIGSIIGERTGKQVRDRYLNNLRPDIKNCDWTEEEDEQLQSLYNELGRKWSQIAHFIHGRTESQVKNRFYSQTKKQKPNRFNKFMNYKLSNTNASDGSRSSAVETNNKDEKLLVALEQGENSSFLDPQDFLCRWNNSIETQENKINWDGYIREDESNTRIHSPYHLLEEITIDLAQLGQKSFLEKNVKELLYTLNESLTETSREAVEDETIFLNSRLF